MGALRDDHLGSLVAICISERKGIQKTAVETAQLISEHGLKGDAHAGPWHRQVSLLDEEQIARMREKGLDLDDGDFGENLVTRGIDLDRLAIGEVLRVGPEALLEVTQRGKECHTRCAIYYQAGDCIMPRHGLGARVIRGGSIVPGDAVVSLGAVQVQVEAAR